MVKHLIDLVIFNAAKLHASFQMNYNKKYKEYQICDNHIFVMLFCIYVAILI